MYLLVTAQKNFHSFSQNFTDAINIQMSEILRKIFGKFF